MRSISRKITILSPYLNRRFFRFQWRW